jgi:drug/metabolite transporter (DMT)-like permease
MFGAMSLLWGVPYLFIRVAVHDVGAVVVVFARVGIATFLLLPIALRRGVLRQLRGRMKAISVLAFVQIIAPFTLISYGEKYVPSSLASLLIAADPLLVAVFALWLDRSERVTGGRLVGLLVGITGVGVLLGLDVGADPAALFGAAMIVFAAAGYAAGALMVKRPVYSDLPSLGVVTAECAIATTLLAPLAVVQAPRHVPGLYTIASLVGLGVLCTAVAWLTFFALIAEVGASRGTVFTYVNPAIAVVLGVVLLGEPVTGWTAAGFLLIIAGSWLSTGGTPPRTFGFLSGRIGRARAVDGFMTAPGSDFTAGRLQRRLGAKPS